MSDVSARRMIDSPTDQDLDGIGKALSGKMDICEVCGGPGSYWLHCDSWTKWMRFGCGCNVTHCEACSKAAKAKSRELIAANRDKAEAAENKMLENIDAGQLARLRYRYYDSFNCSEEFREWVKGVVGEEKMKEYLDVPCACCGKLLGQPKYTFEDKDGNRSLKTVDEIEEYCYKVLGRDPVKDTFKNHQFNDGESEICFQTPIWDYYERKGWNHEEKDFAGSQWKEALNATRGVSCGGNFEWDYGDFIYYMPTRTYLGKFMKRGGDWPEVVQINRKQLEKEQAELRERFGENYYKNEAFWPAYRAIEDKQVWVYYCGKECCAKSTKEHGTMFI